MDITKKEEAAINALKKAAKKWPQSLWLFSADGALCVMKKKPDGSRAVRRLGGSDSIDPDYEIDIIDIENDGGAW